MSIPLQYDCYYDHAHVVYDLVDWVRDKLTRKHWNQLSMNPAAIHLLEANPDKIVWYCLSHNPAAMHLLEANPNKIEWAQLFSNPSSFEIKGYHYDRIRTRPVTKCHRELLRVVLCPREL